MSRKIFSIDIRDDGIAALLVENGLKGNWIQSQLFVPYTAINDDPENIKTQRISEALNKIFREIPVAGTELIVSISPEFISYRNLQVPFKDRKKIRQVLPFELEPTLPYPVDEVTIDFEVVQPADKTDILVGVAKTSEILSIREVFKQFQIEPFIITPGGFASVICLSKFSETNEDFIFVDTDHQYATVFTVVSGRVHIARSFYSNIADPELKARRLSDNIVQVMAAFESLFVAHFEPSKILLSGNGINPDIFNREIEGKLGISVSCVNMLTDANLKINASDDFEFNAGHMNNAISLAAMEILGLRTINFCGERSIVTRYWEEYKNDFIKTGLIAAFVFVLAMFNVLFEAHFLQQEVNQLNREIAFIFQSTFPEVTKIVSPLQQMKAEVAQEREKNMFTGEIEAEIANIDILNEISSRIPAEQDVEITNFVKGDNSLVISGNTDSFNNVDDIKNRLERSEIMKNITISSANLEKSSNRIQFKLKIDL